MRLGLGLFVPLMRGISEFSAALEGSSETLFVPILQATADGDSTLSAYGYLVTTSDATLDGTSDLDARTLESATLEGTSTFVGEIASVFDPDDLMPAWFEDASARTFGADPSLTDADMEAATFVPPWLALTTGTYSKETGSPHGGSQVGRIAYLSLANAAVRAIIYTVGYQYDGASVWARGDGGSGKPSFMHGTTQVNGSTSTDWQQLSASGDFAAGATNFRLILNASSGYAEFDDCDPGACLSVTALDPSSGSDLTDSFEQVTAAYAPYQQADGGLVFDGSQDRTQYAGAAGDFSFLHDGSAFSFCVPITMSSLPSFATIFATEAAGTGRGMVLQVLSDGSVKLTILGNSGASVVTATSAPGVIVAGTTSIISGTYSGSGNVEIYVDGLPLIDATPGTHGTGDPQSAMYLGARDNFHFFPGVIYPPFFNDAAFAGSDRTDLEAWYTDEYSL